MGILKGVADTVYAFRFIRMMVMDWKNWDAYKEGIIDENGKRNRNVKLDTDNKKSAYTPFVRLVANIKRLVSKLPGGGSKLGSFASALYLVKEKTNISEKGLKDICEKCDIEILDFLNEKNEWFLLEDKQLSPGVYRVDNPKLLNKSCSELVWAKDQIRIKDDCFPVGDVFGVDVYEATHIRTNQQIYITANELVR
tara:strand:+ start:1157 stop:1744 length:588 start_codon:yes stop_codon:yes gene_type:complete